MSSRSAATGSRRAWRFLFACLLAAVPAGMVQAAFSSFLPLNFGGSLSYGYTYVSAASASERMQLLGSVTASGYIWQPWFATTSATLTLGIANTTTEISDSDANTISGSFNFSLFPRSRFPFLLNYTRSDSTTANYSDLTQLTGRAAYTMTRLSLRQTYRSRGGSLSNLWYYRTDYTGLLSSSLTNAYGVTYQIHTAPNMLALSANYTTSESTLNDDVPSSLVVALNHNYKPNPDAGVTNLVTFLRTDAGSGKSKSDIAQGSSTFSWRPEHRALNVSGGVRAAKSTTEIPSLTGTASIRERRSLDTNIGFNYRLTRRANLTAGITAGSSESDAGGQTTQVLVTSQNASVNYSSFRYPLGAGLDWMWQATGSVGNVLSRTDIRGSGTVNEKDSSSLRSVGGSLLYNLNGQWSLGRSGSLTSGFSQGLSSSKNSNVEELTNTLNSSFAISGSYRGRRGTTYASLQASDSRTRGVQDSLYQRAGVTLSQDLALTRLSSVVGNLSYDVNLQEYEQPSGDMDRGYRRYGTVSFFYRHDRPFGIYSLRFHSRFNASKEVGNDVPSQRLDWDNRFQYSLGLLSMSASLRLTQNAQGVPVKSLSFQATRSF